MKIQIKSRYTQVLFECDADSVKGALILAIAAKADLSYANLSSANLRYANLSYANLSSANLSSADLSYANLSYANLSSANLSSADLSSANLRYANLSSANLSSADLSSANLRYANLSSADLSSADLSSADLSYANLSSADLSSADLSSAEELSDLTKAQLSILPEGEFVAWKKCQGDIIVKLAVPAGAKRSNSTGRKCRAEFVRVLEIIGGAEQAVSKHDGVTTYKVGETVTGDKWEEDRWVECGGGIHFFITRIEAENY